MERGKRIQLCEGEGKERNTERGREKRKVRARGGDSERKREREMTGTSERTVCMHRSFISRWNRGEKEKKKEARRYRGYTLCGIEMTRARYNVSSYIAYMYIPAKVPAAFIVENVMRRSVNSAGTTRR